MKKHLLFVIGSMTLFSACQKPITETVRFPDAIYDHLGQFDSLGKPLNLQRDAVSTELTNFINFTLPEGRDLSEANPELLNSPQLADLSFSSRSDVYLTFVKQSGAYSSAIAFYTYPSGNPPKKPKDIRKITYAFPNAGNLTTLSPGDKVKLGTFEAGTSLGLMLLSKAWDAEKKSLDKDVVHFCSDDALNPERNPRLKKHAVLIPYQAENKILIGFEDTDRTNPICDHDFNDVVLYFTVIPR